jgi:hypothetical protein
MQSPLSREGERLGYPFLPHSIPCQLACATEMSPRSNVTRIIGINSIDTILGDFFRC